MSTPSRWTALLVGTFACAGAPKSPPADTDVSTDSGSPLDVTVSFAPYWQWTGPSTARFRVETLEPVELELELTRGASAAATPLAVSTADLTHFWPAEEIIDGFAYNDDPGPHHLHELMLDDLAAGEVVGWSLDLGDDVLRGTLTAPPAPGGSFRAIFVGDTMAPYSDGVFARMAAEAPELLLHGGDLQYQSNPADTWTGLSWAMAPATETAALQATVGNHEHEDRDEFSQMYRRLLDGQGEGVADADYYRLDHGGVRFLALDSEAQVEAHQLTAEGSLQLAWLQEQLTDAATDPSVHAVVPFFHRPIYTLAEHAPSEGLRAVLHPLFVDHGVTLVLQAHNHSYERMEADGVTYVTDGGGGALLYDVDASVEDYPDELALRVAASQTFGFTRLDFGASSVELQRIDVDGNVVDAGSIPWRTLAP